MRDVFERARSVPKAIIFFDEFDSIAISRNGSSTEEGHGRRLLAELLIQLTINRSMQQRGRPQGLTNGSVSEETKDGCVDAAPVESRSRVVVIAATNRIADLDEAVLRRFDNKVYVALPNAHEREQMLATFMEGVSTVMSAEDVGLVCRLTQDWSGSELESLCREAAMIPLRAALPFTCAADLDSLRSLQVRPVGLADFEAALNHQLKTMPFQAVAAETEEGQQSEEDGAPAFFSGETGEAVVAEAK